MCDQKMVGHKITSARGIISLLHEEHYQLHEFAIRRLNDIVDEFWFEIADSISIIELYSETENFSERRLASLLASKLHYHLGSQVSAMKYALGADELLFTSENKEYLHTVINKCIEQYKVERHAKNNLTDPRLETIVRKAFNKCLQQRQYSNAVGLALETKRIDLLKEIISCCEDPSSTLEYIFKVAINLFQNDTFRNSILQCLAEIYKTLCNPDFINFCKCLLYLEDHEAIAEILENLLKGNDEGILLAYQICFDLYENGNRKLLWKIMHGLKLTKFDHSEETFLESRQKFMSSILLGNLTTKFYLDFLITNNNTDYFILENMKNVSKNNICHSAVIFANSLMNYGTVSDKFIIEHIDWWCQEANWAEFSATAGLGVINKGSEKDSIRIISAYFPDNTQTESVYTEGGCLYGLGLLHANHGDNIIDYLLDQLKRANSLEVIHGGCLGIGLAALGTNRKDVCNLLKARLCQDEATIGESVGIAMGLVSMGSESGEMLHEMIKFAHDTKHEKLVRGLAIGIALIMFGQLEKCELLVDSLCNDINPLLRCAAMHTLAMAYSGTGNSKVIQRLLSTTVSDPNADVRRAAMQAIGFIFLKDSHKCISTVSLSVDNYNFHTRYGAALALGISCVGTGNEEALSLLWELADDTENIVVQGALIASALILIQHTPSTCSQLTKFKQLYQEITEDKLENEIVKFGAILSQGIINGGGRNVTITLRSRSGQINMGAIAGMLVFTQYWYWFPLIHFLSLSFLPTCLIGINANMKVPQMEFISNSKPSNFGYPPPTKRRKKCEHDDFITFILSFALRGKGNIQQIFIQDNEGEDVEEDIENTDNESEPDFEILSNPTRVSMQQLKFVLVPEGSRYEPVKDITEGGIIMMRDKGKSEGVKSTAIEIQDDENSASSTSEDEVDNDDDVND